ncbi:glucose dehydrogenase [FAD, quinone]-like [Frankliniella occidentalis]|uniref:Glucose dehydrogenase [FAD, quinone]-like n=1 Tax=Frankliniella occidentalis TaxID=133901 RepID=A0A6J1TFF8_FRAOC|nr:glucose dehydrogenase [FAD, quinone]-like [Frankliniella occidentalis]
MYTLTESLLYEATQLYDRSPKEPPHREAVLPEYDVVVVGAGTAGCTLAARLSEVPGWRVLLLEAGGAENIAMDIPLAANLLQFSTANWKYRTEPSDGSCLGMVDKRCNFPRGKVMGGSSVLNYMIHTRGHPEDYDQWARLGNTGWDWASVRPYFLRMEDMTIPELAADTVHHHVGGPVTISHAPFRSAPARAFVRAGREMGFPERDYNGASMIGFSFLQVTMRNGSRWSSNRAYLEPARRRRGLHVSKWSRVTRVLVDPASRTAYGVEFVRDGESRRRVVRARREVILAAGAINSPQLLMLSGIGPRQHLQSMGIAPAVDLPVGNNLMDHVAAGGLMYTIGAKAGFTVSVERLLDNLDLLSEYAVHRTGPMTLPGGTEALGFLRVRRTGANATSGEHGEWPDIELLMASGSLIDEPLLKDNFGIADDLYSKVYKPFARTPSCTVFPMLLRPKSRGTVRLRSRSPTAKPLIHANYFDDPEDLETLVDGVLAVQRLLEMPSMRAIDARIFDVPLPGCAKFRFGTRKYWRCHIRHIPLTIYHQSGTCRMGPAGHKDSVVDPRLRVIGVRGLRVADASIMPAVPAAHTNTPTYMIAEKAADMVKEDHGLRVPRAA